MNWINHLISKVSYSPETCLFLISKYIYQQIVYLWQQFKKFMFINTFQIPIDQYIIWLYVHLNFYGIILNWLIRIRVLWTLFQCLLYIFLYIFRLLVNFENICHFCVELNWARVGCPETLSLFLCFILVKRKAFTKK